MRKTILLAGRPVVQEIFHYKQHWKQQKSQQILNIQIHYTNTYLISPIKEKTKKYYLREPFGKETQLRGVA